jgi:hypothetical protein
MEQLQNKIDAAGRILRIDIQEFFSLYLQDKENPLPELSSFLSGISCVSAEDKIKIEQDISSYDI